MEQSSKPVHFGHASVGRVPVRRPTHSHLQFELGGAGERNRESLQGSDERIKLAVIGRAPVPATVLGAGSDSASNGQRCGGGEGSFENAPWASHAKPAGP